MIVDQTFVQIIKYTCTGGEGYEDIIFSDTSSFCWTSIRNCTMKIPLFITLNAADDNFCGDCMFKDTDFFNTTGSCLLFNQTLAPRIRYGSTEYWYTCNECDTAVRQSFHEYIEP